MTAVKRKHKSYSRAFKQETVSLVAAQGYAVKDAAEAVGIRPNQVYDWQNQSRGKSRGQIEPAIV